MSLLVLLITSLDQCSKLYVMNLWQVLEHHHVIYGATNRFTGIIGWGNLREECAIWFYVSMFLFLTRNEDNDAFRYMNCRTIQHSILWLFTPHPSNHFFCFHISVNVCMCVCTDHGVCVCMFVWVSAHVCVCACVCVHMRVRAWLFEKERRRFNKRFLFINFQSQANRDVTISVTWICIVLLITKLYSTQRCNSNL